MNKNGLINQGNQNQIKAVMKKAKRGEDTVIAFLGGSITQGSLSTKQENCYASLVHQWWVSKFPSAKITMINAGIGGTTSQFGVSRVKAHVLEYKPDFILTEFAVNDEDDEFFEETYEGLVRTTLKDPNNPALLLMNNAWFDSGKSAEKVHLTIAKHYDVPMVSMKATIWSAIQNGEINSKRISPDMLHPNDAGHRLVADVIIYTLEEIYNSLDESDIDVTNKFEIPDPITPNAYENSVRIKNYNMNTNGNEVVLRGFKPDTHTKSDFLDIYSGGFTASNVGDSILIEAECTGLAVQYKKTINLPSPIAMAVIDNDESNPIVLDSNFDETWGDCLYIETAGRNLPYGKHSIRITITTTHEDDKVPFYLVSVIASR